MKILLVNNNTKHLRSLKKQLAGHEVDIQKYHPGIDFRLEGKQLIILSGGGGEGQEVNDTVARGKLWYDDQMQLVRSTRLPIIGICMGFEVICAAYGTKVSKLSTPVRGFTPINMTFHGRQRFGSKHIKQFAHHDWGVAEVDPTHWQVLATSDTGVEAIKHHNRHIMATQFHPEVRGGNLRLRQLVSSL